MEQRKTISIPLRQSRMGFRKASTFPFPRSHVDGSDLEIEGMEHTHERFIDLRTLTKICQNGGLSPPP